MTRYWQKGYAQPGYVGFRFIGRCVGLSPLVISGATTASGDVDDPLSIQLSANYDIDEWEILTGTNGTIDADGLIELVDVTEAGVFAFTVQATDERGRTAVYAVTFTLVDDIAGSVPVNVVRPSVAGLTNPGETLTCTTVEADWTGAPILSYAYQWWKADPVTDDSGNLLIDDEGEQIYDDESRTNIGTDSDEYEVQSGDIGFMIGCSVTATNATGASEAADSDATDAISSPTLTDAYLGSYGLVSATARCTFPAKNLGTVSAARRITVVLETQGGEAVTHEEVNIIVGGTSYALTKRDQVQAGAATAQQSMFRGSVPAGTVGDVECVVGTGAFTGRYVIHMWADGRPSAPTAIVKNGLNPLVGQSITVPANGALIGAAMSLNASAQTCSWSHGTEDYDTNVIGAGNVNSSGIRRTTAGTITLLPTWSGGAPRRFIAAALGPSS